MKSTTELGADLISDRKWA